MDYAACRDALERAEADVTAAEFHGTLCAMLCTRPDLKMEACVAEIAVCEHPPEGSAWSRVLREHGERSRRAFAEGDFDLELLLPEDGASLAERSDALCEWCRGFLYGLGLSGGDISRRLSDDAREVVADLVEFTRLDVEEEASEQAEKALTEIVEYLRVGVLLIYEELARAREESPGDETVPPPPLH
jgi:uncharacterized protein YgfB (UPF0149 family)